MRLGLVLDYDAPDWRDVASELWDAFAQSLRRDRVVYAKFGVCLPETRDDAMEFWKARARYLDPADGHEATFMRFRSELPLAGSAEDVLRALPTKTRYMVNKARHYGLEVVEGSMSDLPEFQRLKVETAERDGIAHLSMGETREIFETVLADGIGAFHLVRIVPGRTLSVLRDDLAGWEAELEKTLKKRKQNPNYVADVRNSIAKLQAQIADLEAVAESHPDGMFLAAGLCAHAGRKMTYQYAASSDMLRDYFPNYLMLWSFIERACELGCDTFDFAETYEGDTHGLSQFKLKWGTVTVPYTGDFEYVAAHPAGDLFRFLMSRRG